MREKLCFVQFLHPGGEHWPDEPGVKRWNLGRRHRRKFMRAPGRMVQSSGAAMDADLVFWGEWEPDSTTSLIENPEPEGPRVVHEPFLPSPAPSGGQNTDPFIFGESFHYTGCLQHTVSGPTQLRFLERGSVILFGSCTGRTKFVLDTLMVVDTYRDHSRADYAEIRRAVSPTYAAATIDPWYSGESPSSQSHRLYLGATFDAPLAGMFSFFPCLPASDAPRGFARPEIDLAEIVTPTMTQGKRLNPQADLASVRSLWDRVVSIVENEGLALGTYAELPPNRAAGYR